MSDAVRMLEVHGRRYRWMNRPVVVVCVDGGAYEYVLQAAEAGSAPWMRELIRTGTVLMADSAMPSWPVGEKIQEFGFRQIIHVRECAGRPSVSQAILLFPWAISEY